MGRKAKGPKSSGIWQPSHRKESFILSRIIISFVITLVLIFSPAVGQFVNQQTALLEQSSYIENIDYLDEEINPAEDNAVPENSDEVLPDEEKTVSPKAETKAVGNVASDVISTTEPVKSPGAFSAVEATTAPVKEATPKAAETPRVESTPKATKAPGAATPKATEVPEAKPTPKVTETPKTNATVKATETPKARSVAAATAEPPKSVAAEPKETSTPAPTKAPVVSTPRPTEAPKPTEPPKEPVESAIPKESAPVSNDNVFDTSKVSSGNIGVRYNNTSGKRLKLMIQNGSSSEAYNLDGKGSLETFPLKFGNGEYTISIMENTEGN
jgi:chemotaxis protein histidine kinase CheA